MFASNALLVLISLTCLSAIESVRIQSSCSRDLEMHYRTGLGGLSSIQISDCGPTVSVCPFKVAKNVPMELTYWSGTHFPDARIQIAGIVAGVHVPFKLNPDSVCHYGNCPIRGKKNTIKIELPILPIYPRIRLFVQLSLVAYDRDTIFCVRFPAQIVN